MRMTIDVTLDYRLALPGAAILMIEPAAISGQRIESFDLDLGGLDQDGTGPVARQPADEGVGTRLIADLQDRLYCRLRAEVTVLRPHVALAGLSATPLVAMPADALRYLMPSRYCEVERFVHFVSTRFAGLEGGALVKAIGNWIQRNIDYVGGVSTTETTAGDSFLDRRGVCRDYAHLMIAMCRAMQIPARIASVYAPGVTPPDFHAVAQVFLDGDWHLVDPSGMAEPENMVLIALGRDATDVAFLTTTGPAEMITQRIAVETV